MAFPEERRREHLPQTPCKLSITRRIFKEIQRIVQPFVEESLGRPSAVALIGPRQLGKTSLALEIGGSREAVDLDLEDRDDRSRLAEPKERLPAVPPPELSRVPPS